MALTSVVPLAGWPGMSAIRSDLDIESPACEYAHHQEAVTRVVRLRSSESQVSTWICLLWSMALLGLLLLPSHYRAGAESPHAHSLLQLWADATNGTVRHHKDHGLVHPGRDLSTSWFDPSVGAIDVVPFVGFDGEQLDATKQQESAPVSSGVHLLLTATMGIVALGLCRAPIADLDRHHSGLPPRILVPPPRWTSAA